MSSDNSERKPCSSEGRDSEEGPKPKRQRRSGWDQPAPQPTGAAAHKEEKSLEITVQESSTIPPVDQAAVQKLAFLKAQQVLANSGLNIPIAAPGTTPLKTLENRIYVGSLDYNITETEVRAIFSSIGPIRSIDMSYDSALNRSKGYCFIDFEDPAHAKAAFGLHGIEIAGRPVDH